MYYSRTLSSMPFPNWGDVPTWVAAGAAGAALVGAALAYLKQSEAVAGQNEQLRLQREQFADQQEANRQQAEVFRLQAEELRASLAKLERETQEQRSAQARRILVTQELAPRQRPDQVQGAGSDKTLSEAVVIDVNNTSDMPIYELTISWHKGTALWANPDHRPLLQPGKKAQQFYPLPLDLPANVDRSVFGGVVYFRDANRIYSRIRPNGEQPEELAPGHGPGKIDISPVLPGMGPCVRLSCLVLGDRLGRGPPLASCADQVVEFGGGQGGVQLGLVVAPGLAGLQDGPHRGPALRPLGSRPISSAIAPALCEMVAAGEGRRRRIRCLRTDRRWPGSDRWPGSGFRSRAGSWRGSRRAAGRSGAGSGPARAAARARGSRARPGRPRSGSFLVCCS